MIESEDTKQKMELYKEAFSIAYSKPIPIWRILFCSIESNGKFYQKRVRKLLEEAENE